MSGRRTGEYDLTCPVLSLLSAAPGGSMTTSALKRAVKKTVSLTSGDLGQSKTRPDKMIDQIVGNIVSHKGKAKRNIVYSGLVSYARTARTKTGTLTITAAGLAHLSTNCP